MPSRNAFNRQIATGYGSYVSGDKGLSSPCCQTCPGRRGRLNRARSQSGFFGGATRACPSAAAVAAKVSLFFGQSLVITAYLLQLGP